MLFRSIVFNKSKNRKTIPPKLSNLLPIIVKIGNLKRNESLDKKIKKGFVPRVPSSPAQTDKKIGIIRSPKIIVVLIKICLLKFFIL